MRDWRHRRGLTQIEAAALAGITQATWSNYETGKRVPTVFQALHVAAALDITLGQVLGTDDHVFLAESRLAQALDVAERMLA